jgi:hypothetical protein
MKREVPPHQRSRRQQTLPENICAEMHVMMTVNALRVASVKAAEFVQLGRHHAFKGTNQLRMKPPPFDFISAEPSR